MKKVILFTLFLFITCSLFAQKFEAFALGSSFESLKQLIPVNSEVDNHFENINTKTFEYEYTSLGIKSNIELIFYKDKLVRIEFHYPNTFRDRITNALVKKYGKYIDSVYENYNGFCMWSLDNFMIKFYPSKYIDYFLIYELYDTNGEEYFELRNNADETIDDQDHF